MAPEQGREPAMGRVQEDIGGGALLCVCVVAGSGGGLWTDVWLSLFIFVNVPKVRVLELAAPFTALQITQNQMNAHR